MPDFEHIYSLQSTDLEINNQAKRLEGIQEKLGDRASIEAVQKVLDSLFVRLTEFTAKQKDLEDSISSLSTRISTAEQKLYSGQVVNPRELQDLQEDIAQLGRQRDTHEIDVLEILEQSDPIRNQHDEIQKKLTIAESVWNTQQVKLDEDKLLALETSKKLKTKREEIASLIPATELQLYEQVRSRHPLGKGVAKIKNNMCESCLVVLPASQIQSVRSNSSSARCTSCGLILLPEA